MKLFITNTIRRLSEWRRRKQFTHDVGNGGISHGRAISGLRKPLTHHAAMGRHYRLARESRLNQLHRRYQRLFSLTKNA